MAQREKPKPTPEKEYDDLLEKWDPARVAADIVLHYDLAGLPREVVTAVVERALWEMGISNDSFRDLVVLEALWVCIRR